MWNASLLATVDEAAAAVLTMTEGLGEEELFRSRMTRREVTRQIGVLASALSGIDGEARDVLAEIDWRAWSSIAARIAGGGAAGDEALWFAAISLVPATIMWLRVYRRNQPALFAFKT